MYLYEKFINISIGLCNGTKVLTSIYVEIASNIRQIQNIFFYLIYINLALDLKKLLTLI